MSAAADADRVRGRLLAAARANLLLRPVLLVAALAQSVLVARLLGPEGLAVVAAVTAASTSLVVLYDFGLTRSLPKILADLGVRHGGAAVAPVQARLLRLRVALVGVSLVGLAWVERAHLVEGRWLGVSALAFLALIGARALADAVLGFRRNAATAAFHHGRLLALQARFAIGTPLITVAAAALTRDPVAVVLVTVVAATAEGAVLARRASYDLDAAPPDAGGPGAPPPPLGALLRRYGRYLAMTHGVFAFNRLVFGLPLALAVLAALGASAAELGRVSVAVSLLRQVLDLANLPLAGLRGPLLARLAAQGDERRLERAQLVLTALVVLGGGVLAVGVSTLAEPVLGALYGADYRDAVAWGATGATALLAASFFTLGNTTLHQMERFGAELVGLGGALAVLGLGLPLVLERVDVASWPLVTVLALVAARAVFWVVTDLWADWTLFRLRGLGLKLRGLVALAAALAAGSAIGDGGLARGALAALSGAALFLGIFRALGGMGRETRAIVLAHAPPRLRPVLRLL